MALPLASRAGGHATPSLADVMSKISSDMSLSPRQRQETRSALRVIGRAIGRPPERLA
jgi:hypothetical protein